MHCFLLLVHSANNVQTTCDGDYQAKQRTADGGMITYAYTLYN